MGKIIANRVKCLKCKNIIESTHRHDYVPCSCGNIAVDGGVAYLRRGGKGIDDNSYEELSEYEYIEINKQHDKDGFILIDKKNEDILEDAFYCLGNALFLDKRKSKQISKDTSKSILEQYEWEDDSALWILESNGERRILKRKENDAD